MSVDEADGAGDNDIIRTELFYLDEAGIAAATDSDWTISVASNVDVLIGGGIAIEHARQGDPEVSATSSLDDVRAQRTGPRTSSAMAASSASATRNRSF